MSRSGYSDDYEYCNLWAQTVKRAIEGKRGQAFLRELIEALDALQVKSLIDENLITDTGEVCALGAVGKSRGLQMAGLDPTDPERMGQIFGISTALAKEIVYQNDEWHSFRNGADRWKHMRQWAEKNLTKDPANSDQGRGGV